MTADGADISTTAREWVKNNKGEIISRFAGLVVPAAGIAVSIFMAGSPGAGKTEFSRRLIGRQFGADTKLIARIDPDEVRDMLPCYIPGRAELFQSAVSLAIEKIHDHVLNEHKNFLLDGTLSNLEVARRNVTRSLKKGRKVLVQYVYQDPVVAWDFTQKREAVEGRNIPKDAFVREFVHAKDDVNLLKAEFGKDIVLDVVTRNIQTQEYKFEFNVENVDNHIDKIYTIDELNQIL